jgi:hypothetical protein
MAFVTGLTSPFTGAFGLLGRRLGVRMDGAGRKRGIVWSELSLKLLHTSNELFDPVEKSVDESSRFRRQFEIDIGRNASFEQDWIGSKLGGGTRRCFRFRFSQCLGHAKSIDIPSDTIGHSTKIFPDP